MANNELYGFEAFAAYRGGGWHKACSLFDREDLSIKNVMDLFQEMLDEPARKEYRR